MLWLVYDEIPLQRFVRAIRKFDFSWLLLSLILGILSHLSRALRWQILIEPLDYKPRLSNTFFAVMVMYLANMAIPRMGEVSRCGIMKKYEKIPFTKVLGTVVLERMVDLILLIFLFAFVVIVQFDTVINFTLKNFDVSNKLLDIELIVLILGITAFATVTLYFSIRKQLKETKIYKKASEKIKSFKEGMKTIFKMQRKWEFIGHSVFIYFMYFAMIYVCFFGYQPTQHLSALIGLTVFVLASFGMVAPVSGGFGAWHFMAIETLFVFGISKTPDGEDFALVVHGTMTLLLIVVGFISLILLPIFNKQKLEKKAD